MTASNKSTESDESDESDDQQPNRSGSTDPSSTPDTGEHTGIARDPYARCRDDWPDVIVNPDYAIPTPRR